VARLPAYLSPIKFVTVRSLNLHRWRKSPAELALMRRSAQLASAAMTQCMQQSQPGVHEHQLAASFEYQ